MPLFEVQIRADVFLAAQLQGLRSRRICLPPPFSVGPTSVQVQRIIFGPNALRHKTDVPTFSGEAELDATQIVQSITLHLTTLDMIMATPNAPAPLVLPPITFDAVLNLNYYPAPMGGCVMHTSFDRLEWPVAPPVPSWVSVHDFQELIENYARQMLVSKAVPFNFAAWLPPELEEIKKAGVSVDRDLTFIAFRVDPFGSYPDVQWGNFHRGAIHDRLAGAEWAYFVDARTLESTLSFRIESAVKALPQKGFRLQAVGSHYWSDGGTPRVDSALGIYIDAPVIPTTYVSPNIRSTFSVDAEQGRLAMDVHLDEVQELLNVGPDLVDGLKYAVPPIGFVLELALGDELSELKNVLGGLEIPSSDELVCTQIHPTHHRCTMDLPIPSISGARLLVRDCRAFVDGMALTGILHMLNLAPGELSVNASHFAWVGPDISCGSASNNLLDAVEREPERYASLYAQIDLTSDGTLPIHVCAVSIVNDPLQVFPTTAPGLRTNQEVLPAKITLSMASPTAPDYLAHPYPLDVLISTTAGIRLVRIPPPPAFTPEAAEWVKSSVRVQLLACPAVPEWFRHGGAFDLHWIVDPLLDPPLEWIGTHEWSIAIDGLRPGQVVSLLNAQGEALTRAVSMPGIPMRLSARVPAGAGADLMLQLDRDVGDRAHQVGIDPSGEDGEGQGVEVWQQPLALASSVPLPRPCRQLLPAGRWSRMGVIAVMDDAIMALDLSNPYAPDRIAMWHLPGIQGVCDWNGQMLAYGDFGFRAVSPAAYASPIGPECERSAIRDADAGMTVLYVLTDAGLEVRSPHSLCRIGEVSLRGARRMTRAGGYVLVGGAFGLAVLDMADERHPRLGDVREDIDVIDIEAPAGTLAGGATVGLADGSAITVVVHDERLTEIATHPSASRMHRVLPIGSLLVRADADNKRLVIERFGGRRMTVPAATREIADRVSGARSIRAFRGID